MTAQTFPCPFCHCATRGKHAAPRKRATVSACADPAHCWQWDHLCYALRMARKGKGRRATVSTGYAPATIRGQTVENVRITVAA